MLEAAAISELESTAGEKQAALDAWLEKKQTDIKALAADPDIVEGTFQLKTTPAVYVLPSIMQRRLLQHFQLRVSEGEFLSVMLLDSESGKVMVSTDPNEQSKPQDAHAFFLKGNQEAYLTPVYFSQELQAPAITAVAPVAAEDGQLLGVLVGRIDIDELNAIIQRRSGLRQTDDAFLVNASHQPITQPRFLPDPAVLQRGIYTVPVNNCLQGKSGTVFADDYRGIPVIAAYRWLPERQLCLIVKISQAEALAQEHSLAIKNLWIGLVALLVATVIAVGLARTLIAPIRAMQTAAQRYRDGDLTVQLPESRQDELGLLAREFNGMAAALAEKENQLRRHSHELEKRVVERTKDLQKSQDLLSKSQAISHLGSWEFDPINQHLVWSDEVYHILGLQGQEFEPTYEAFLEIAHPEDRSFVDETYSASLRQGQETYEVEHRIVRRDNGETRFVYIKCENTRDGSGQIIRSVGMIQDITERKQAELNLADAVEFTGRILTSAPIGIFTYKLSGQCLSANAAAAQMVGATMEQLKNQNFHELESWRRSGLYDLALQAIATKQLTADDLHIRTTFGRDAWYRAQFVTFHSGGEELLLMIFNDISERKQAEMALIASEERFRRYFEMGLIGMAITAPAKGFLEVNDRLCDILGYSREELLNITWDRLTYPDDLETDVLLFNRLLAGEIDSYSIEKRFLHKNGGIVHTAISVNSVRKADGSLDYLVALMEDVTERKYAEAALEASEKRFRSWIENSSDIVTVIDISGTIQYESPSLQRWLGYRPEELCGKYAFDFVHPDDQGKLLSLFQNNIDNPPESLAAEFRFRHRDGSWRYLEGVGRTYTDEYGDTVALINSRDITDRKQAEEALKEKERLLSDAQRIGQIGSFIYDIQNMRVKFSDEMYYLLDISPENFHHDRKDFLALIYPSDRPLAAKWMDDLIAGIQSKELDFRIFRKNGEMRYLRCHGVVEFDSDGRPIRFVEMMQDITERKLAEIQINQQIKRLTALSEIDRSNISGAGQRQILDVILSQTITQLHVDAAGILLLDSSRQALHYAAGEGFGTQRLQEIRVGLGESQAGRVAKERRLIRLPDLREQTQDPLFNFLVGEESFVSYFGVPLIVKREVLGVLEVFQRTFFQPYQEWLDFLNTLAGQTAIALENATLLGNLQASNQELAQAYDATLEGWSHAMDLRDRETEGHTQRVTELTLKVARAMGIGEDQLVHIRRGALLHDIGKLGIPDQILFKADQLTAEEWEIMQKHPEYAYDMLSSIHYLKPALPIPYFHHEKWDGSGYPLGLCGEQIPLEARIFSLVDVWDALLSDRPYRKAWTVERTLEYIRTLAGSHFDPNVVNCFIKVMKS